jgi:hypothetical protein
MKSLLLLLVVFVFILGFRNTFFPAAAIGINEQFSPAVKPARKQPPLKKTQPVLEPVLESSADLSESVSEEMVPSPGFQNFSEAASSESDETIGVTGTVRFVDEEGGFYGIEGDDNQRYFPINWSAQYKVDGLRVKLKGRWNTIDGEGFESLPGWGKPISILEISRI